MRVLSTKGSVSALEGFHAFDLDVVPRGAFVLFAAGDFEEGFEAFEGIEVVVVPSGFRVRVTAVEIQAAFDAVVESVAVDVCPSAFLFRFSDNPFKGGRDEPFLFFGLGQSISENAQDVPCVS